MPVELTAEQKAKIEQTELRPGSHSLDALKAEKPTACVMELISILNNQPESLAAPPCVSETIRDEMIAFWDTTNVPTRKRIIDELVPYVMHTAPTKEGKIHVWNSKGGFERIIRGIVTDEGDEEYIAAEDLRTEKAGRLWSKSVPEKIEIIKEMCDIARFE